MKNRIVRFNEFGSPEVLKIFEERDFQIVFKKKSFADGVNYNNFGNKYGSIQYTDLLLGKK